MKPPGHFDSGLETGGPVSLETGNEPFDQQRFFLADFSHGVHAHLMKGNIRILIEGTPKIGETLRVKVDRPVAINLPAEAFHVQWMRDGKPLWGENGREYTVTEYDLHCRITAFVTDAFGLTSDPKDIVP